VMMTVTPSLFGLVPLLRRSEYLTPTRRPFKSRSTTPGASGSS